MRANGTLVSWNDEKGFGFIKPNADKKQIFVHAKAFANRNCRPEINRSVIYSESFDNRGRPCAVNVEFVGDKITKNKTVQKETLSFALATFFLTIVATSVITNRMPAVILVLYVITSLATFREYEKDKSAAQRNVRRTPEDTLHFLSLIGGWPGALVARQKLRHKSQKQPFRAVFWVTVVLNCGVFIYLYTPDGVAILRSLIADSPIMAKVLFPIR